MQFLVALLHIHHIHFQGFTFFVNYPDNMEAYDEGVFRQTRTSDGKAGGVKD